MWRGESPTRFSCKPTVTGLPSNDGGYQRGFCLSHPGPAIVAPVTIAAAPYMSIMTLRKTPRSARAVENIAGRVHFSKADPLGYQAIANCRPIHELQTTIRHRAVLDHGTLSCRFKGRNFRHTDVEGGVIPASPG